MLFVAALAAVLMSAADAACHDHAAFQKAQWPNCVQVNDKLTVYAGVEGDLVKLGMYVETTLQGWTSLALAGNGGMKGANEIVVRQVNGTFVAEDRYSTGYSTPTLDTDQHARLIWAEQSAGHTSWGVLLPVNSCDKEDYAVWDAKAYMLWALGSSHEFNYHGQTNRGQFHINLHSGSKPAMKYTNTTEHSVKMPDVLIEAVAGNPNPSNPYKCLIKDLHASSPLFTAKRHAVKFSPDLNPATEKYVHHMILFSCKGTKPEGYEDGSVVADCENMPRGCNDIIWVWAKGAGVIEFPDGIGMPVGGEVRWTALQMHYYNPGLDKGMKDKSGVKMLVSGLLQKHDASYLVLNGGTSPQMQDPIPHGKAHHVIPQMQVPSSCTSKWTEPLNIMAAVHHQHLLGKHMTIEVARDGKHLGVIRDEHRYDFNHQSLEQSRLKQLLPGDELLLTCTYDSSSAKSPTKFGDLTENEMCFAVVLYYPAQKHDNALIIKNMVWKDVCAVPFTAPNPDNISMCSGLYISDPYEYFFKLPDVGLTALKLCNEGGPIRVGPLNVDFMTTEQIINMLKSNARTKAFADLMCPACYKGKNCTQQDLAAHGTSMCKGACQENGFSLWPDVSTAPAVPEPTHMVWCAKETTPMNISFPPRTCAAKGDITSAAATTLTAALKRAADEAPAPSKTDSTSGSSQPRGTSFAALSVAASFSLAAALAL